MKIPIFQIDAFSRELFHGNPAAVCPLAQWLSDELMQQIAMENNLAETAFFVKEANGYRIRWFTPAVEVDLCGHATLAAAFVAFQFEHHPDNAIVFNSRSGPLRVTRNADLLTLNFPADTLEKVAATSELVSGIGLQPVECYKGKSDYMLVYRAPEEIESITPDMGRIAELPARGVIVTAPGHEVDFVSRFFAPRSGIPEDAVTGSAHTTMTPYWASRLGKNELNAMQLSKRRGWISCRMAGDRVEISGHARTYLIGEIDT